MTRPGLLRLRGAIRELVSRRLDEQLERSFCIAEREERKLRVRTVRALVLEVETIKRTSHFATGLVDTVIEDIIEGDWRRAREGVEIFTFDGESEDLRACHAPLWETARQLVAAACDEHDALERGESGDN